MLSNLKTRIVALVNRATEKIFLRGTTPVQRFDKTDGAPIPQPPTRAKRSETRKIWQLFKTYDRRSGHPRLSNDRYLRNVSNVYGKPFQQIAFWHIEGSLSGLIKEWNDQRRMKGANAIRNLNDPKEVTRFYQPGRNQKHDVLETNPDEFMHLLRGETPGPEQTKV